MAYRIGIDIGGTFTDFALVDDKSGRLSVHKQLTTPDDPSRAVLEGVAKVAEMSGIAVGEIDSIVHGSTLVTNAVIERKGAVTGMLVTKGFASVLDIGIEQRYDLFDLRLRFPKPLIPLARRREIGERVLHSGAVETPLYPDEVRAAVRDLVETQGIQSLAICFLHSYREPGHERAAAKLVAV
jgi:N-methylhydantoinase A